MNTKLITQIGEEMSKYCEELNTRMSEFEIKQLEYKFEARFSVKLHKEYALLLALVNGIEWNGFIIYGIKNEMESESTNEIIDLFDMNEVWHENVSLRKYIFIGDSCISWYCYDKTLKKFVELDKPSGSKVDEFEDFGELLNSVLSNALM